MIHIGRCREGNSLYRGWRMKGQPSFWYNVHMRKKRVIEQNRCYHLVSLLAHRAFFLKAKGFFLSMKIKRLWWGLIYSHEFDKIAKILS